MEEMKTISGDTMPQEIKKWNWGAFMFNIIWGIGNRSYLTLLCLIPIFNIVWIFVCGAKGNQWAWQKGNYASAEEFMKVQQTWNRAGLAWFILMIVMIIIYVIILASLFASLVTSYGQL